MCVSSWVQGEGMMGNRESTKVLPWLVHPICQTRWTGVLSSQRKTTNSTLSGSIAVEERQVSVDVFRHRLLYPYIFRLCLHPAETDFSQHLATDCVSIDCLSSDFASLLTFTFGICHSRLTDKIKQRKIHIHGHLTQLCLFGSSSWVQIIKKSLYEHSSVQDRFSCTVDQLVIQCNCGCIFIHSSLRTHIYTRIQPSQSWNVARAIGSQLPHLLLSFLCVFSRPESCEVGPTKICISLVTRKAYAIRFMIWQMEMHWYW